MAGFLGVKSAKLFEAQATVVAVDEHLQGRPEIGEGLVDPALDHLLLQGLPEALDDAVGLGLADILPNDNYTSPLTTTTNPHGE